MVHHRTRKQPVMLLRGQSAAGASGSHIERPDKVFKHRQIAVLSYTRMKRMLG